MVLQSVPVRTADDLRRMQAFAGTFPQYTVHVTDLPYRLASPALHDAPERDTALWFHEGELIAWAVWQSPWAKLDYAIHPAWSSQTGPELLSWAEARVRHVAALDHRPAICSMSARDDDQDRITLLEHAGYESASWTTNRQARDLTEPPPKPELPAGFTIRPLRGESEIEAYVAAHQAAFNSTRMTPAWRHRILAMPDYRPDLDLVVEAPDGRIAAFTIMWVAALPNGHLEGQFEPVGTHPNFQRRGLARALLLDAMHRLRAAGGTCAVVEADGVRTSARPLYEALMPSRGYSIAHYAKNL